MEEFIQHLNDYSGWTGEDLRETALNLHAAKEELFRLRGEQGGEKDLNARISVEWGRSKMPMNEATIDNLLEAIALAATAKLVGDELAFPEQKAYPYPD